MLIIFKVILSITAVILTICSAAAVEDREYGIGFFMILAVLACMYAVVH